MGSSSYSCLVTYNQELLLHVVLLQVNEIAWDTTGEIFFLTTGNGEATVSFISLLSTIYILSVALSL